MTLPSDVEETGVTATLGDGVLHVHLPKAGGAKATRIAIT